MDAGQEMRAQEGEIRSRAYSCMLLWTCTASTHNPSRCNTYTLCRHKSVEASR